MNMSYYDGLVGTIPDSYKQFMDLLKKLEGGVIHFNHTESDITTGRGVYKAKDTKATLLWDYIDAVAKECGLSGVSSEWGRIKANLDTINAKVNSNTIEWLEYLFYKEYYANVYIDKFPTALQPTIVSIKATTQVGCAKAIQFAIQNMHRLSPSLLGLNTDEVTAIDGALGKNSVKAIERLSRLNKTEIELFKMYILFYMWEYYQELASGNPGKYGQYIRGWKNRMFDTLNINVTR